MKKAECRMKNFRMSLNGGGRAAGGRVSSFFILHSSFSARAFTLLELLLAVLVFSIVLTALHVVFFSALRLRSKTADAIERALPLQQTVAIIKRDLENIVPPGGALSGQLQSTPTLNTSSGSTGGTMGSRNHLSGPQFY